jgi:hypothetical protein
MYYLEYQGVLPPSLRKMVVARKLFPSIEHIKKKKKKKKREQGE